MPRSRIVLEFIGAAGIHPRDPSRCRCRGSDPSGSRCHLLLAPFPVTRPALPGASIHLPASSSDGSARSIPPERGGSRPPLRCSWDGGRWEFLLGGVYPTWDGLGSIFPADVVFQGSQDPPLGSFPDPFPRRARIGGKSITEAFCLIISQLIDSFPRSALPCPMAERSLVHPCFLVEICGFGFPVDRGFVLRSLGERSHGWLALCLPWIFSVL